jgi:hypothetical protein
MAGLGFYHSQFQNIVLVAYNTFSCHRNSEEFLLDVRMLISFKRYYESPITHNSETRLPVSFVSNAIHVYVTETVSTNDALQIPLSRCWHGAGDGAAVEPCSIVSVIIWISIQHYEC